MTSPNYVINFQDILGYGNYGTVYGASGVSQDDKKYAVKVFKSSDASAEEIEIMQYLSNYKFEYIANIEEVMTINGRKAIVMERLDGGEVFERILNDGSFSETKAARCLVNLVKALIDLNKKALVLHRDVKPENLVYINQDNNSEIKLIDFGLAIKATPFSIEQGIRLGKRPAGTASYMSPETIRTCEYSAKSDVWSAGVTLYALLSGTAPFDQDNRLRQRQQILSGSYIPLDTPAWKHVSSEAKELIAKMLTVNSADRISLDDILQHPWIQRASSLPESKFDEGYLNEIRSLSARSNFKKIVNATVLTIRLRRNMLTSVFRTSSSNGDKDHANGSSIDATSGGSVIDIVHNDPFNRTLSSDGLPGFAMEQIKDLKERFAIAAAESAARLKPAASTSSATATVPAAAPDRELGVDYPAFEAVMYAVGLENLATPHVFDIFDTDGNGMVDYREFISTLATFRTSDSDSMRLYFDMFDVDGSGEISFEELKLVMAALLHEENDSLHSEHDRSSPTHELETQSSTVSMAETLLNDNDKVDSNNISVFEFVPVQLVSDAMKSVSSGRSTPVKERSVSPVTGPAPLLSRFSTAASSTASTSSRGSFVRMQSLAKGEANPFQSIFKFTPKVEEGRTIEDLFREMDTNKDGKISFDEFKGWMERDIDKLKNVVQDALN